jgi:UDP-N-acetylglucosamine 2-epimerase (non-hydrolysing)
MKTIVHVIGARPNYMKIAPLMEALRTGSPFRQVLVNTGQHYDDMMARSFVRDLALPTPDYDLGVGSASHAVQTAKVMIAFEEVCLAERPDLVMVVGDVNSTLAASLVAAKLVIPVAHVEAGLRSNDRTMPEEINRIVTDLCRTCC